MELHELLVKHLARFFNGGVHYIFKKLNMPKSSPLCLNFSTYPQIGCSYYDIVTYL